LALASLLVSTAMVTAADARGKRVARSQYNPPYAAIVIDANSGKILESAAAESPRHPASLTKIMTLYLLFERLETGQIKLTTQLPVSAHAAAQAPSKLGLKPGETIDVDTAIHAIVTKSANDVAVIVAEALGGSETEFARGMTAKARALGMYHTTYVNASGLPDERQITTAHDQATLGRAIHDRFPKFYRYFSTRSFVYRGKTIRNHNHLLGRIDGLDGIKTGYIRESGFNIVTSVQRGGRYIVTAVFGGPSARARDASVTELIARSIKVAAVKRTSPPVVEGASAVAQAETPKAPVKQVVVQAEAPKAPAKPTVEKVVQTVQVATAAALPPLTPAAPAAVAVAAVPVEPKSATPALPAPEPGSTDPIRPNPVKTISVQSDMVQTALLSPLPSADRAITPAPPTANPANITVIATVRGEQPPPAKVPAKAPEPVVTQVASADSTVPVKSAAQELAAKPHGGWMIQVGAFDGEKEAKDRLTAAQEKAKGALASANGFTEPVAKGDKKLFRARFAGLEKSQAETACQSLKRSEIPCILLKN
jgi:D-alanyl-D-alanine carboxypeptidase